MVFSVLKSAYAEIVTDGSLGIATELNGPDFAITTDLGQQKGPNLFHSFSFFNLKSGEQADFAAGNGIQNIIARVTGGSTSSIDGAINSEQAGLWMINPAGWVFGSNAAINVNGAFHVSSADGVRFEDGAVFYADLSKNSVLSVSAPVGLSFLQPQKAKITLDESIIQRPEQSTLSITAGEVELNNASIKAPKGNILIGASASAGDWTIDEDGLNTENTGTLGPVQVQNEQFIPIPTQQSIDISSQVEGGAQGRIQIVAGDTGLKNAKLFALTFADHSSGDIQLQNQGDLNIERSTLQSDALSGSNGAAGNIEISANNMNMNGNSSISASTQSFSTGDAGAVRLDINGKLSLTGSNTQIFSVVNGEGSGNTMTLNAGSMALSDSAVIRTSTGSDSDAGNIEIQAGQLVLFSGGTIGSSAFGAENTGNGGNIRINTGVLQMGGGDTLITSSSFNRSGQGGAIEIRSGQMLLTDSSEIRALSESAGSAGNIEINNSGLMQIEQNKISTEAVAGNGGNIVIKSQDMVLTNTQITTSLEGVEGNGGNITINSEILAMNTGFVQANTTAVGGRGGDIVVNAGQFIPSRGLVAVGGDQRVPFVPDSGLNVIQAAAPDGVSGEVTVSKVELNITGEIQPIKSDFSVQRPISENPCEIKRGEKMSTLLTVGQGGLPENAADDVIVPLTVPESGSDDDLGSSPESLEQSHTPKHNCRMARQ